MLLAGRRMPAFADNFSILNYHAADTRVWGRIEDSSRELYRPLHMRRPVSKGSDELLRCKNWLGALEVIAASLQKASEPQRVVSQLVEVPMSEVAVSSTPSSHSHKNWLNWKQ